MASGRYTAYHVYQNLSFPEAQKAATWPYKLPEYQCRHSQRGALFQFENMVERIHFDAAVTTCCDQPVLNFANKPQYSDASRPMNPTDCGARVQSVGCTVLEIFVESASAFCADAGAKVRRIKIQCPSQCPDLVSILGGGKIKGQYGDFKSLGVEAGEVLILEYTPDSTLIAGWYDNCSGAAPITEEFCGGYTLSYILRAGLDSPGGCDCDCCGSHGMFPAPAMTLMAPSSVDAGWANDVEIPGTISGDESCSGGSIMGTFSGIGSASVAWSSPLQYHSNGSTRFVTRDPAAVGSSGSPACCGGNIFWSGTDGCEGGDTGQTIINARIGSSTIIPASGSVLAEGTGYAFSGSGACSYSSSADLTIATSCLTNTSASLARYDGFVQRTLAGPLQFSGTHQCSGCCGSGSVSVSFSNGCGGTYSGRYDVRRTYSDSSQVGYVYKCRDVYSGSQHYYKPTRADLWCEGTSGSFSDISAESHATLQECVSRISGTGAMHISGAAGCSGSLSGSTSCCWYSDNGLSGYDFRSKVYSSSGSRCCAVDTQSGAWVLSGSGASCCPVTG
ncbi:MAG: hypothetical protein ACOYXY_04225 [Thermodesulfobacteriota bacterium]